MALPEEKKRASLPLSSPDKHSNPPNKRANISWEWLWKNETFQDCIITLVPPSKLLLTDGNTKEPTDAPGVLLSLPSHRVVLASASNYFRQRLVCWDQQQKGLEVKPEPGTSPSPSPPALPAPAAGSACALLEETIQPDQLPAAEAVLQFMYTQELPQPVDTLVLITIARLAERWDVPLCTQACLQLLSNLRASDLPASLIGHLMADDLPRSVTDQPLYTPLLDACKQRLVQLWGSVQAVVADEQLRNAFCSLPFSALKLWARLDDLKVDNENSVAVLISHWWAVNMKQLSTPGGPAAREAQLKDTKLQLSSLVRLNQLSASFFAGVLQHLPWFVPPQEAFNILCMSRALHPSKGAGLQQGIKDRLPPAWLAKPRAADGAQVVSQQWVVSKQDLQQLHRDAESGRVLRESPGLYWCGYVWHLCLSLNSHKEALWVGVRARSALPALYTTPALMEAKFTIACKEASSKGFTRRETLNFGDGAALQPSNCNGTPRLLLVPASPTPRTASVPPDSLMLDGKLHLQLTMEAMQ